MLQKDMMEGQDCIRNYSKECMPFLNGFHFLKIVPSSKKKKLYQVPILFVIPQGT